MTRSRLLWVLVTILMVGWSVVIHETFEHDGLEVSLTFLATIAVAIAIMRILSMSMPLQRLKDIHRLTREIDARLSAKPEPIDEHDAPREILPIIQATNRLIRYQQDRYENERDFTANASHELRTPLAGIRLQTQLAMRATDDAARERAFANVMRAVDRATTLVEQLLVLSRLTAEKIELDRVPVDLTQLCARVIGELSEWMADRKSTIILTRTAPVIILANADSIAILINNLIRNAITHTEDGSHVEVAVQQDGHNALLRVVDDGPGIPEQEMKAVMERFAKASGSKGGTGLGLAIVKRIADLHHADVLLSRPQSGSGLAVTVSFPLPPRQGKS